MQPAPRLLQFDRPILRYEFSSAHCYNPEEACYPAYVGPVYATDAEFYRLPLDCASVNLTLPPDWTERRTSPAPDDQSADAEFYRHLDDIAGALASKVMQAVVAVDYTDRDGNDHRVGALNAIARAIRVYLLNFPYSQVQRDGWQKTLADVLSAPLFTWSEAITPTHQAIARLGDVPMWFQQRGSDFFSVHPAYAPFYFWRDQLSFYRFVRYSPVWGFGFTAAFAQKIMVSVQKWTQSIISGDPAVEWYGFPRWSGDSIAAFYMRTRSTYFPTGNPEEGTVEQVDASSRPDLDGFDWCDRSWIQFVGLQPRSWIQTLDAAANKARDNRRRSEVIEALGFMLSALALSGAISAISSAGLSVQSGASLISAVDSLPGVDLGQVGQAISLVGKAYRLGDVASSLGIGDIDAIDNQDLPDAGLAGEAGEAMDFSDLDVGDFDPDPYGIDEILTDQGVDFGGTDIFGDVATGDIGGYEDYGTVPPIDEASIEYGAGVMDADLSSLVSDNSSIFGGFSLGGFVASLSQLYKDYRAGQQQSATQAAGGAQRPVVTPGQVLRLPNGGTLQTRTDGSSVITLPNGSQQTVLANGQVVAGAPTAQMIPGIPNIALLGALGLLGVALVLRR